jgi:hypothetical protein
MTLMRRLFPALTLAAFAVLLFKHVSYPLLWQDEAETAMFATRILEYGYPKVHGPKNVLYEFGKDDRIGIKESADAYIGTTWGHFYFAGPALAWAKRTADLYEKTARLRIPFAAAGLLGLVCFVAAAKPAFGGDRGRAELFAGLFFLLCCFSVSLILHLREVRYYPLQVLAGGAILAVYLRHQIYGRLGFAGYTVGLAALLVLLFNVFYSAYFAFGLLLGLHCLYVGGRAGEAWRGRAAAAARGLAPLVLSALVLVPWFLYFETFTIASGFSQQMGFDAASYGRNLRAILDHLARRELLVAALVARVALAALARGDGLAWREIDPKSRVAGFLVAFALGYVAIVCVNPLSYERYFLVLAPVLTTAFLLDAFTLVEALPARFAQGRRRRLAGAVAAALVALVAATGGQRLQDLRGRLHEITHRLEGPVDHLVAHLRTRYERPEDLIIATNYEAHPLMFYLGSRVIVGYSLNNIEAERELEPDVVVPRRHWTPAAPELERFLERDRFVKVRLPVVDLPYNNIAALSKTPSIPITHRFELGRSEDPNKNLSVHHRIRGGDGRGPSPGEGER